jgi:MFS family permease
MSAGGGTALLIAAAIAISYFDRQTLPVAIKAIQHEIPVTNFQFGQLNLAFLVAYGAMYAGGGKLIDMLGTRRGFFAIMVWWSLACASHGLAAGFGMLAASRLLLGMGEGGGFPAATKAVAEFFPAAERSTAMGLINAGTAVGAVIAPPGIALVIGTLGWRLGVFYFRRDWAVLVLLVAEGDAGGRHGEGWLTVAGWSRGFARLVRTVAQPAGAGLVAAKFLSDAA